MRTVSPAITTRKEVTSTALCEGIKSVAVGKFGNKSVSPELVEKIKAELKALDENDEPDRALLWQRASFFGSLFAKAELEPQEHILLGWCRTPFTQVYRSGKDRGPGSCSAGELIAYVRGPGGETSSLLQELTRFSQKLLNGDRLTQEEAEELGNLLFQISDDCSAQCLKCLIAHVMRVRHESCEELSGLAKAARGTVNSEFKRPVDFRESIPSTALIAEPFDGVNKNYMLTPIVAAHLQKQYGFVPLLSCGSTSGPKYGPNLKMVARELGCPNITTTDILRDSLGVYPFGLVADQEVIAPPLAAWVALRRTIVKRPALATVEKYVDVVPSPGSELFVASAFHGSYVDRMISVAEAVGFRKYIIVQKGQEGTLGLRASGRTKAMVSVGVKTDVENDESYRRNAFEWGMDDVGLGVREDSKFEGMSKNIDEAVQENCRLIDKWVKNGASGSSEFDDKVKITLGMIDEAMNRINGQ